MYKQEKQTKLHKGKNVRLQVAYEGQEISYPESEVQIQFIQISYTNEQRITIEMEN